MSNDEAEFEQELRELYRHAQKQCRTLISQEWTWQPAPDAQEVADRRKQTGTLRCNFETLDDSSALSEILEFLGRWKKEIQVSSSGNSLSLTGSRGDLCAMLQIAELSDLIMEGSRPKTTQERSIIHYNWYRNASGTATAYCENQFEARSLFTAVKEEGLNPARNRPYRVENIPLQEKVTGRHSPRLCVEIGNAEKLGALLKENDREIRDVKVTDYVPAHEVRSMAKQLEPRDSGDRKSNPRQH